MKLPPQPSEAPTVDGRRDPLLPAVWALGTAILWWLSVGAAYLMHRASRFDENSAAGIVLGSATWILPWATFVSAVIAISASGG